MIPASKLNIVESDFSSGATTPKTHSLQSFSSLHYDCSVGTDCTLHLQQSATSDFWSDSDYTLLTLHNREAGSVPLKLPFVRTWLSTVDGTDPSGDGTFVRFHGGRNMNVNAHGHRTLSGGSAGDEFLSAGRLSNYAYLDTARNVSIYGSASETSLVLTPQISHDLTTWYPLSTTISVDASGYFHGDLTVNTDFLTLSTSIDASMTSHVDWK